MSDPESPSEPELNVVESDTNKTSAELYITYQVCHCR